MKKKTKYISGILLLILAIGLYLYLKKYTPVLDMFSQEKIQSFISGYGAWGPIVFILIEIVAVIFSQLPNIPLTLAAGAIWGPLLGATFAVIGGLIGGCLAFTISRFLGKDIVEKLVGDQYEIIYEIPEKYLTIGIFVTRLVPFLSFDIISYGAGLTDIKFRHFFIATLLGMIPMTLLFAYMGEKIMFGEVWSIVMTGLVVIAMIALPVILKKYDWNFQER